MKRTISILLAVASSGCMLVACQTGLEEGRFDPTAEGAGDPPELGKVSTPLVLEAPGSASLPAVVNEGDCTEGHDQTLDACDWVNSVDAVVYGTVADLRFVDTPTIGAGARPGEIVSVASCDNVDPALVISLDVAEVISGSAPKRVDVQIGARELKEWSPKPIRDKDGSVSWLDTSGGKFKGTLRVGQPLGLALHSVSGGGGWALLGEPLFDLDARQAPQFQPRVECTEPAPRGAFADLSGLRSALRSCAGKATATAGARKVRVRETKMPSKFGTEAGVAAWCMQKPQALEPGTCNVEADCVGGSSCEAGKCVTRRVASPTRTAAPSRPR